MYLSSDVDSHFASWFDFEVNKKKYKLLKSGLFATYCVVLSIDACEAPPTKCLCYSCKAR